MKRLLTSLLIGGLLLISTDVVAAGPSDAASNPDGKSNGDSVQLIVPGSATIAITHATLSAMPRTQATAAVHAEPPKMWAGVSLVAIMHQANVPQATQLRGREMTKIVRVTGADGYAVVFGLAELDATFSNTTVILVDQHEGKALSPDDGPFRLVVPGDKRAARWVRNVRTIEVVDAAAPAANHPR